ncbi:MAG: C40 family peptidase [Alphaproteobacteria bacterium]|nr:C40 family peptidase [Alphaproteobacteria bacterium]
MVMKTELAQPRSASEIVTLARGWIGTPYHHQASLRGVGTDCLGLVRGVWRELYSAEPERMSAYTRDWSATGAETLLAAATRHFVELDVAAAQAGDVLIFRYRERLPAKHCAVLSAPDRFIHAIEGAPVCEVAMTNWWRRRVAGAFRFPGVTD